MNRRFESWDDVDSALRELAELEVEVQRIEGEMTESINAIKERAKKRSAFPVKKIKELTKAIEQFAAENKAEFAKKRSKELTFGKVAFRLVTSVPVPRDKAKVEALLKSLKAFGLSECITYVEKPDREKLTELDDATLAKLGLAKKVQDKFRVEPYIEKVADAS
jgi:phage host-nuclease inhibitor protein Gam